MKKIAKVPELGNNAPTTFSGLIIKIRKKQRIFFISFLKFNKENILIECI